MKTSIRELGTYTVAIDTLSPRVTPLNKAQWKTGKVQFKIGDAETGIKDYKVKIDGEFALFGFSSKNAKLWMKHPERLKKGVAHKLELVSLQENTVRENIQYGNVYEEIKNLQPQDTLQLLLNAKTEDEKNFYELIGDFLLQAKQRDVVGKNLF